MRRVYGGTFWLLSAVFVLLRAAPLCAADYQRWYVLEMQGQRAGWMHGTQLAEGERITTTSEMRMSMRRGEAKVDIAIRTEFVESKGGKPISGKSSMTMAATPTVTEYLFKDGEVEVISGSGAARTKASQPLPDGVWLTPAAAQEYLSKRLEAGAQEIVVRSLDISLGLQAITTTHKVLERTTAEALGKVVPAIKVSSTTDLQPGVESVGFVDERGVPIRSETDLGGIKMVIILADRELAQLEGDAPELMNSTLVEPKGKVDEPRTARRASYVLSVPTGSMTDLPSGGPQTVTRITDSSVQVVVDLDNVAPAPNEDADDPKYLEASQMINKDDSVVTRLTREALEGTKPENHAVRTEALRKMVFKHIKNKSFGVGFASAAEVARTCTGDCSEHAALLTAMLRNAGYVSRVATGLVYVDEFADRKGIFGYHMWSQVLLEENGVKRWVDLDATMPSGRKFGPGGFDATHITIAVTSLADGDSINGLVTLAPLLGRLEITIE